MTLARSPESFALKATFAVSSRFPQGLYFTPVEISTMFTGSRYSGGLRNTGKAHSIYIDKGRLANAGCARKAGADYICCHVNRLATAISTPPE